jgi:hypothetical protein
MRDAQGIEAEISQARAAGSPPAGCPLRGREELERKARFFGATAQKNAPSIF